MTESATTEDLTTVAGIVPTLQAIDPPWDIFGALFVFRSTRDDHSPVMVPRYEEFAAGLDNVKVHSLDVFDPANQAWLSQLLVFAVPTLLWIRLPADDQLPDFRLVDLPGGTVEIIMRHVGTVMVKKLHADAEKVVEKILSA